MTDIVSLPISSWDEPASPEDRARAIHELERGSVLLFPDLDFPLEGGETRFLSPEVVGQRKSVSFDPASGVLRGTSVAGEEGERLHAMMKRYAESSRNLLRNLLPHYNAGLHQARTSFRPVEIEGRPTSWRKDDTRLHVDSFPATPTHGTRILRVFTNVNPNGKSRRWRLGESFEDVARHYLPSVRGPMPGSSLVLDWLHITKERRSAYDHYMLRIHDGMKANPKYQSEVAQRVVEFAPGSTWIVYTDQVSHAAMVGQHAFEQTFHLPIAAMRDPSQSPLSVLERLLDRKLA
ncbi:MAG: Kdo hydroxylase family protein [Betaproteobacteria bacterium]